MKDIKVTLPSGKTITVPYGTQVESIFKNNDEFKSIIDTTIGAFVNNELASLNFKIVINCEIKPVSINKFAGNRIYRDSLCYLLTKSTKKLFPERRLVISNSLSNSYYYYFENFEDISEQEVKTIEKAMREDIEKDIPITREIISYQEAIDYFSENNNWKDTYLLLKNMNFDSIVLYTCEDYKDVAHTPLASRTGILKYFEIMKYSNGFLLRYPDTEKQPDYISPFVDIPILSKTYQEYKAWGKIQNFSSVGELNEHITAGRAEDIIWMAEALHDKKTAKIADQIAEKRDTIKVVLIAGPSSSGKTTFAKKLSIQLRVVGFNPIILSFDDYYVDREKTPKDENGEYDFESIDAIDIELFNQNLLELLDGKEVEIPAFDFISGKRVYKGHKIKMDRKTLLVLEGIHGLNEKLTKKIDPALKHKVYISALTQLNLDDHSRIPTTDNRLLRRMIRDFHFRGYSAIDTLSRWPSVRNGEKRNIFPFQGFADSVFNSALDYELAVLRTFAQPILKTVKPYHELYSEAKRLERLLSNFNNIPVRFVPRTSLLREFIGDSDFKY